MDIDISPKTVLIIFLATVTFLLFAHIIGLVFKFYFDRETLLGFAYLFDFKKEQNIPTLYSSFALIVSSILLLFIALLHKKLGSSYILWLFLAIIFLFLGIDESSRIHERISGLTKNSFDTSGYFYFAWVVPYLLATIVLAIMYAKFLFKLPREIAILFIISGFIFVFGSIGFEMIEGAQMDKYGREIENTLGYALLVTIEEFMEMIGIVIFIYALMLYIVREFGAVSLHLKIK